MTNYLRYNDTLVAKIETDEWVYEEWKIDSGPNPVFFASQQRKVHKARPDRRDYRERGENENGR